MMATEIAYKALKLKSLPGLELIEDGLCVFCGTTVKNKMGYPLRKGFVSGSFTDVFNGMVLDGDCGCEHCYTTKNDWRVQGTMPTQRSRTDKKTGKKIVTEIHGVRFPEPDKSNPCVGMVFIHNKGKCSYKQIFLNNIKRVLMNPAPDGAEFVVNLAVAASGAQQALMRHTIWKAAVNIDQDNYEVQFFNKKMNFSRDMFKDTVERIIKLIDNGMATSPAMFSINKSEFAFSEKNNTEEFQKLVADMSIYRPEQLMLPSYVARFILKSRKLNKKGETK